MAKLSKRRRAINEKVELGKVYQPEEAFSLLKELSSVKFSETVDVAINSVLTKKSDQVVRGATTCPMVQAKMFVFVYSLRAMPLMQQKRPAELVGWTSLQMRSKVAIRILML